MTEPARLFRASEHRLDRAETLRDPIAAPFRALLFASPEHGAEIVLGAPAAKRMDFARNRERERAHPGAAGGVFGENRRKWISLLEILTNCQRLRDQFAVVFQRRYLALRIKGLVGGRARLAEMSG